MTIFSESSKNPNMRLAILLLAAGEGSRLGGFPKALLKKEGDTLLKRFITSVQSLQPIETLVVTGFYSAEVEQEVQSLKSACPYSLSTVKNPMPESGQPSSVRLGLESLQSDYDVLIIALCDQPNISSPEIESLLLQFKQAGSGKEIVLPMVHEKRGNPVLFSRRVINQILLIPGMVCRPFMDQHPELVKTFVSNNPAYLMDVDSQADIQKLGLDPIK